MAGLRFLAALLAAMALQSAEAVRKRSTKSIAKQANTKFIAGVPVLNYYTALEAEPRGEHEAKEWVVLVKPGVSDAQISQMCSVAKEGCKLLGNPDAGGVPFFEMRGTESDLEGVLQAGTGLVKYVEIDMTMQAIPELMIAEAEADLWGLERIHVERNARPGGWGVTVFIIDTGIRTTHEDFGGRAISALDLTLPYIVECNGALHCAQDYHGHGTHCAGTAAGATYGVAPVAAIRSIKVLDDNGKGSWSRFYSALNYMAASSIRPAVASMSLGGFGNQQAMVDAVDAAVNAGMILVVAGGNDANDACDYSPAFVPTVITVGSTDSTGTRSSFSNYGSCTNIWAPGSRILSAGISSDTASVTSSGTSMACPHVAGGAALVLQFNPSFNYAKVLKTLHADARTDSLVGLLAGDVNKELYVGFDAPPPPGRVAQPSAPKL